MLVTTKNEKIFDIEVMRNYCRCRIEGKKEYQSIPFYAVKWVSDNWFQPDAVKNVFKIKSSKP